MSAVDEKQRIIVLSGRSTFASPVYRSWTDKISGPLDYVQDYGPLWEPPPDTGLVVTHRHYHAPETTLLPRLVEQGIPVLILADGILEFRNTWQNPKVNPSAIFQPVLGHKLAVIGASQARIIDSWGNPGKCEVVGLPRMDDLPLIPARAPAGKVLRVLVATARTPGFTPDQREAIVRSLRDLKNWFGSHPALHGRAVDIRWRLTGALADEIGVPESVTDITGRQMAEALAESDILITTPSTALLEGMRFGLPTALLDYTNSPSYVPAAWSITAADHLDSVVPELMNPPPEKLSLQNFLLHDALECHTPATPRLISLIDKMLAIAADCRRNHRTIEFPANILPADAIAQRSSGAAPENASADSRLQAERDELAALAQAQQEEILQLEQKLQSIVGAKFSTLLGEALRQKWRRFSRRSNPS